MTVTELIERLQELDGELVVTVYNDNGLYYELEDDHLEVEAAHQPEWADGGWETTIWNETPPEKVRNIVTIL